MKNIFLVIVSITSSFLFSQETVFVFNRSGFTDFIVTPCEQKTQRELYTKCLDWISVTYKNPNEVIKAKIENEYIRIEGSSDNLVCYNAWGKRCGNSKYEIEISFKDGKYKFDVLNISQYNTPTQYSSAVWTNLDLSNTEVYFDKKGIIKSSYKYFPEMIPGYFNKLNISLSDFLLNKNISSKKSDW
jgi:hypothetical protein